MVYSVKGQKMETPGCGGKLGRPVGSIKTKDKKKEEYKEVISLLHKGYVIRDVARLTGKGISTVQRIKKELVD